VYESFFGLREPPFHVTPDPRFLHPSPTHRDALAYLEYGIAQRKGFLAITGEVGVGKTTVVRSLLANLAGRAEVAIVLNTKLTFRQMLTFILADLEIGARRGSKAEMLLAFHRHLLAVHGKGRTTVLVLDEAQNLTLDAMEELRLLSNLETDSAKLLQILLVGQPELHAMLLLPALRQLRQRIPGIVEIGALPPGEVGSYIETRLKVAGGGAHRALFLPEATERIAAASGGIPRLVNLIADRCLLHAFVAGRHEIDAGIVQGAVEELNGGTRTRAAPAAATGAGWL
jgi:general secretion pathway protein A